MVYYGIMRTKVQIPPKSSPYIYNLRSSRIDITVPYQDTTIGSLVRASEHVPSNSRLQKTNKVTDIEPGSTANTPKIQK